MSLTDLPPRSAVVRIVAVTGVLWAGLAIALLPAGGPRTDPLVGGKKKGKKAKGKARKKGKAKMAAKAGSIGKTLTPKKLGKQPTKGRWTSQRSERKGVVVNRDKAFRGRNLVVLGLGPVLLTELDGSPVQRWSVSPKALFPDAEVGRRDARGLDHFRMARILPDGDLLALVDPVGLARIGPEGEVRWKRANGAHHDFDVVTDAVWVLTRTDRKADYLERIGLDGTEQARISLPDALSASPDHGGLWRTQLQANAVEVLREDGAHPAFRAGRILVSLRVPNALVLVDPDEERVVWGSQGPFARQNQPTMTGPDRILLLDNGPSARKSRVLELDLGPDDAWTERLAWGGVPNEPLQVARGGHVQRLPNGNTLVTAPDEHKAVEFTAEGEVVWVYSSPVHRDGWVAKVLQVERIPE